MTTSRNSWHNLKNAGLLFLLVFFYSACRQPAPPDLKVNANDNNLYLQQDLWWYNGRLFSGYIQEVQSYQLVIFQIPVIEGMANGKAIGFYENGHKMLERSYANGKLEGEYREWWRNGKCRYSLFYKDNKFEGTQKAFFKNGHLREEANYLAGKPEGLQRVWDESGQLTSNYTIRNNRLYGVIKVQSCLPGAAH